MSQKELSVSCLEIMETLPLYLLQVFPVNTQAIKLMPQSKHKQLEVETRTDSST
jgi:hypothetical protein